MTEIFGRDYAAAYDLLYAEKDYDAECDILEAAFREAERPVHTVLDLGCGTGIHAIKLAQRGYEVVGVDLSEEMLAGARDRALGVSNVEFALGDMRSVRVGRSFDAVICMFAVLGYQTSDQDVADALGTVRNHLAPGGPFIFDVWYGPAVEATGPEPRTRVIPTEAGELERQASATLEPAAHLCTVSYELTSRQASMPDRVVREEHRMRYFFADEVDESLRAAGLSLTRLVPFPDHGQGLTAETWNVLAVAAG